MNIKERKEEKLSIEFFKFQDLLGGIEMIRKKRSLIWGIIILAIITFGLMTTAQAQYWEALPPYNLLWPLWSPTLSPIAATGMPVPVPLISSLDNSTILPVQPVLAWDPAQIYPWLLYNTPDTFGGGLTYFDPFYGLNPFPPPYLLDSAGAPLPITLPVGFADLPPTDLEDFAPFVPIGNFFFNARYGVDLFSLLTAANIWGLPASGLPIF